MKIIFRQFRCILTKYKILLAIMICAFIPLIYLKRQIIAGGDIFWHLYPEYEVHNIIQLWDDNEDLGHIVLPGSVGGGPTRLIPYLCTWALLKLAGLSIPLIFRIWLFLMYVLLGFSMYYLTSVIGFRKNEAKIASIFLYMFNLYILQAYWFSHLYLLSLTFMAISLGLLIRGIQKHDYKYCILIGLLSFFSMDVATNPPTYISSWMPLLLYLLYYIIITPRRGMSFFLKFTSLIMLVSFAINSLWILPVVFFVLRGFKLPEVLSLSHLLWASSNAKLINCFRFMGSWFFNERAFGTPYVSCSGIYNTSVFVFLTTFIPLFAFFPVLFSKHRGDKESILFFTILAIIGLFLAKGPNEPLGSLYIWLFNNFPGFSMFREPWAKFMPLVVLSYAVLVGFLVDYIHKLGRPLGKVISFSLIALLIINAWPFYTGNLAPTARVGLLPSLQVNVPDYWIEASYWLNNQPGDWRILLLPENPFYQVHYFWGYHGVDITRGYLLSKTVVTYYTCGGYYFHPISHKFVKELYNQIRQVKLLDKRLGISNILNLLSIKYILVRGDLDWTHYNTTNMKSPEDLSLFLEREYGIELVRTIGPLKIYMNKLYFPRIYVPETVVLIHENTDSLFDLLSNDAFNTRIAFLLNSSFESDQFFDFNVAQVHYRELPVISYQRVNSAKYVVKVYNAMSPFILVFTDSFDRDWIAKINGKVIATHFVINGYANGWYINKTGSYTIILEFLPQTIFYVGAFLSISTLTLCLIYLASETRFVIKIRDHRLLNDNIMS